jgi:enoyl-CoA hydratase
MPAGDLISRVPPPAPTRRSAAAEPGRAPPARPGTVPAVIHLDRHDRVALVTIDRQDRRNAIDHDSLLALHARIGEAVAGGARVVVLTGAGGHFCAGADLSTLEDVSFTRSLRSLLDALVELPVATVAAVEGAALGLGTQLATACDLRVATEDARFGIPAARLGLMVDARTVQRLASLAGDGPSRAMLLAAEQVDGAAAHRLGLVQRLGDLEAALGWAAEIAELAPMTIAGHKLSLNRLAVEPSDPSVTAAFAAAWDSADLQEGMAAFRERRPPRFEGR